MKLSTSDPSNNTTSSTSAVLSFSGKKEKGHSTAARLPAVYSLLADVLHVPDASEGYLKALHRVLNAARATEEDEAQLVALPLVVCESAGSMWQQAVPVTSAWLALHIAAQLLDDVEDRELPPTADLVIDSAKVVNLATGFIAAADLALMHLTREVHCDLQPSFQRTIIQMASGQHMELDSQDSYGLAEYFQIIGAKSGSFFSLAAYAGARCATKDPHLLSQFKQFGYNIGILIQLLDDWADWHQPAGKGDLAMGQRTLPVYYSLEVAPPADATWLRQLLLRAPTDNVAEGRARDIIKGLGAETYMLAEINRYRNRALAILADIDGSPTLTTNATGASVKGLYEWVDTIRLPI